VNNPPNGPQPHFLPIRVSMEIMTQRGVRKISLNNSSEMDFCRSEKALGCKLTVENENWGMILSGTSSLVRNDTLSVGVNIEFPE